jgi:hypothetical protein
MATISAALPAKTRPRFYVGIAALLIAIVVAGFWLSYYGALLTGTLAPRLNWWVIHVHAAAFLVWVFCFLAEASLVQAGNVASHRRFGTIIAGYGFFLVAFGTVASFLMVLNRMAEGLPFDDAAAFLFVPLKDIAMFGGFLTAAVVAIARGSLEAHKRLMLLATLAFTQVGMGRLLTSVFGTFLRTHEHGHALFNIVWCVPIALVIGYELATRRRVHSVYVVGAVLFLLRILAAEPFMRSEFWLAIARASLRPFVLD